MTEMHVTPPPPVTGPISEWKQSFNNHLTLAATLGVTVLSMICALLFYSHVALNHDAAWLLVAAERMWQGAVAYGPAVVEINPPLILWLNYIVVAGADLIGVDQIAFFRVTIFSLVILASVAAARLMSFWDVRPTFDSSWFFVLALSIFLWLPGYDFGQREHMFLMSSFVIVAFYAGQQTRGGPSAVTRNIFFSIACVGVFLKPHFIIPFAMLQLYLLFRNGIKATIRDHGLLIMSALALIYIMSAAVIHPLYFTDTIPLAITNYGAYSRPIMAMLSAGPLIKLAATALIVLAYRKEGRVGRFICYLWIWSVGCYLMFLIQAKGWSYHLLPFLGCQLGIVGMGMQIFLTKHWARRREPFHAVVLTISVFVAVTATLGVTQSPISNRIMVPPGDVLHGQCGGRCATISALFREFAADQSIYFFTTRVSDTFPAANYAGVNSSSRFSTLWLIPAIARAEAHMQHEEHEGYSATWLHKAVVEDFERNPPALILIDQSERKTYLEEVSFSYLEFFSRDADFARIWRNYSYLRTQDGLGVYVRNGDR